MVIQASGAAKAFELSRRLENVPHSLHQELVPLLHCGVSKAKPVIDSRFDMSRWRSRRLLVGRPVTGGSTYSISSGLSQPFCVLLCSPSKDKADQQQGDNDEQEVGDHFVGTRAC